MPGPDPKKSAHLQQCSVVYHPRNVKRNASTAFVRFNQVRLPHAGLGNQIDGAQPQKHPSRSRETEGKRKPWTGQQQQGTDGANIPKLPTLDPV